MTSSLWNWLLFTLIQRDKVKWVCVTLNEGYLRAANRGSKKVYRFLIKIWHISLNFFGLSLLIFLRLQIYEAIAAIFWQSASYVLISSLIFSAGYYIGTVFLFRQLKSYFALFLITARSWLCAISSFYSVERAFKWQLIRKTIYNEQSQFRKTKSKRKGKPLRAYL